MLCDVVDTGTWPTAAAPLCSTRSCRCDRPLGRADDRPRAGRSGRSRSRHAGHDGDRCGLCGPVRSAGDAALPAAGNGAAVVVAGRRADRDRRVCDRVWRQSPVHGFQRAGQRIRVRLALHPLGRIAVSLLCRGGSAAGRPQAAGGDRGGAGRRSVVHRRGAGLPAASGADPRLHRLRAGLRGRRSRRPDRGLLDHQLYPARPRHRRHAQGAQGGTRGRACSGGLCRP